MSNDDLPNYRVPRNPMREVELLTEGERLLLPEAAAERLEALLDRARDEPAFMPDIHRFSLCFERAEGGTFTMPGRLWVQEFQRRIGPILTQCGIALAEGQHGALSQWDREIWKPRQDELKRRRKGQRDA